MNFEQISKEIEEESKLFTATLEYELTNGYALIMALEDGTELFAARVNLERSVLDSSHDFAAISWNEETKRAFISGEINTRAVLSRRPDSGEQLYRVCFVPGGGGVRFSAQKAFLTDAPSMDWPADYLGYDGVHPCEGMKL